MRLAHSLRLGLLLVLATASTACASMRKVSVGEESSQTYSIDVTNQRNSTMTVSWSDGSDTRTLGTVAAGRTERFIIAGAKSTSISVTGRNSSGASSGPYSVTLVAGAAQKVTLR